MTVDVQREEDEERGRYVVLQDGAEAQMAYRLDGPRTLVIIHTGVPSELSRQGIGQAMVRRAVEDARAQERTIIPQCPFAKAQIARHPEW